jgi:hypothetical protein
MKVKFSDDLTPFPHLNLCDVAKVVATKCDNVFIVLVSGSSTEKATIIAVLDPEQVRFVGETIHLDDFHVVYRYPEAELNLGRSA